MGEEKKKHICYRCGGEATRKVRGRKYCRICALVVNMMGWVEPLGAPVGFPTAPPGVPEAEEEEMLDD